MYTSHFGLTEVPFMITPDPRYLFMGGCHREAMAHLLYGIHLSHLVRGNLPDARDGAEVMVGVERRV